MRLHKICIAHTSVNDMAVSDKIEQKPFKGIHRYISTQSITTKYAESCSISEFAAVNKDPHHLKCVTGLTG